MRRIFLTIFLIILTGTAFADTTTGLLAWWRFDEDSGTSAYDSSGNGNTISFSNSPAWVTGKLGYALQFDGLNNIVTATIKGTVTDYTIAFWQYVTGLSDTNEILDVAIGGTTFYSENNLAFKVVNGSWACSSGGAFGSVGSSASVYLDQWVHVVFTSQSGNTSAYLNGVYQANCSATATAVTNPSFQIGKIYNPYGHRDIIGILDEVRFYNRALSSSDITQLYKTGIMVLKKGQLHGFKINF